MIFVWAAREVPPRCWLASVQASCKGALQHACTGICQCTHSDLKATQAWQAMGWHDNDRIGGTWVHSELGKA
eukprot:9033072-Alexandrium_andersonii.AAC.1